MKTSWIVIAGLLLRSSTASAQEGAQADTLGRVVQLPPIEVSTARPADRAPLARSILGREEIGARNWGQDTPMLLAALPGAYAYSDAGNGIGYSYLSIRAFPQRRISVLVDGVPLNDPESHEVYWIDHPDLLASTAEAQVQRGVGSALYGAASVGGSVNLETSPFSWSGPRSAVQLAYGSFETKRLMLEQASGPLAGGWNLYGRYSRIETDGYRDQADSRLWSYAFSARKELGRHVLRVNLYGGPEETHLAYLGVPRETLEGALTGDADKDRRFNPITYPGERDHFFEPHYELIHSWSAAPGVALSQTLFFFDGEGYYDERRLGQELSSYRLTPWTTSDSTLFPRSYYAQDGSGALVQDGSGRFTVERADLVRRRWIRNHHFGWIPRLRIEHAGGALTVGGELRAHDGHHVGTVIGGSGLPVGTEPDHVYYDYHPRTLSSGLFLREEWRVLPRLQATADLAWRHQGYFMRGDRFDGIRFDQPYDFAIPRLGLTWTPSPAISAFAAAAHSRREPAFRDLYDGEGAGGVPLLRNGEPLIRPERVNDIEVGAEWRPKAGTELRANLFRMDFRDELVYAGQFDTDLGYPILGNAARSLHQGVELGATSVWGRSPVTSREEQGASGSARAPELSLSANATFGDYHFVEYREVYGTAPSDVVSYDGNAIGFFPATLANLSARVAWRGARIGLEARHASRIYLDNTETASASIEPRTVLDLNAGWGVSPSTGARAELGFRVFNLLDENYETGGYMDYDALGNLTPRFIPAATRSFLGELRVEF